MPQTATANPKPQAASRKLETEGREASQWGMGAVHIGCSGWNYKSWRGRFYPAELPVRAWLQYYASVFDTVEVNNTFYRLPERRQFVSWRKQAPPRFLFAVKASRFLTHLKRLREPAEPVRRLITRAAGLGSHLGPILYQLPGTLRFDPERLGAFLAELPARTAARRGQPAVALRHAIEFRDRSWYVKETFELLERHRVALCLHDKAGSEIDGPDVGPFLYLRLHGPSGRYHGSYSENALQRWAAVVARGRRRRREVFVYFNNDVEAAAPGNALALRRMAV